MIIVGGEAAVARMSARWWQSSTTASIGRPVWHAHSMPAYQQLGSTQMNSPNQPNQPIGQHIDTLTPAAACNKSLQQSNSTKRVHAGE